MKKYLSLWKKALDDLSGQDTIQSFPSEVYYKDNADSTLESVEISKRVWLSLIGFDSAWPVQRQLLISALEVVSENLHVSQARVALLIGLVTALWENSDYPGQLIEKIRSLKAEHLKQWVLPELACITLMTLLILWLNTSKESNSAIQDDELHSAFIELWPEMHDIIQNKTEGTFCDLNCLLLYTEWSVRRDIHMPLNRYVFIVTNIFSDSLSSEQFFTLDDDDYRKKMLVCLYLSTLYSEEHKSKQKQEEET